MAVYDNASELCNEVPEIYFNEYKVLSDAKKRELGNKFDPTNLFLETQNCDIWFENEESADTTKDGAENSADTTKGGEEESADTTKSGEEEPVDLSSMPPLGNEEEVKEGKGLKILTPNKLLTRLPVILA